MKHKTTFEKLPQTNVGRSKNWKTLRAICLLLFLSVSFTAYSQITVNVKDISLRASLKKIEQVSNYKFFYNESLPELNQKVSLNVKDATIEQTMQQLLGKMELTYKKEQENVIVLIRKPQEKQRNIKVSGTVVDSNGEPIIGASVVVKGTSNGTITDLDGNFSINDVSETSQLTVSYIGYKPVQLRATDKNMAKVVLQEDSKMIEEVVVVGYGVQKKVILTGAVGIADSEILEDRPIGNIAQGLQGAIPNLNIDFASGNPNAATTFNVRGATSLNGGQALLLVDGVETSDLSLLNPQDIESVSVLKDAASTAIYGARANGGVILVTTKRGKEGVASVSYKFKGGANFARTGYDYLNAEDYIYYNRLGYKRTGRSGIDNQMGYGVGNDLFDIRYLDDTTKGLLNEGWQQMTDPNDPTKQLLFKDYSGQLKDAAFKDPSFTQDHYLNITGGNDKGTFAASLGY